MMNADGDNPFDGSSYGFTMPQPDEKLPSQATVDPELGDPLVAVFSGGWGDVHKHMAQGRRQMLRNSALRGVAWMAVMTGLYTAMAAGINAMRTEPLDGHVAGKWGLIGLASAMVSYSAVRLVTAIKYDKEDDRNLPEFIATPLTTVPVTMLLLATEKNWKSVGDGFAVGGAAVGMIALTAALAGLGYFAKKALQNCRHKPLDVGDLYADLGGKYEVTL
ncbi:MAG: hypothetical protein P1U63_11135 [Coxiellaceae bacterium]|nr:hypothetical protein [Coxiellaceae bacterium]